jgi:3-oxoacyl-[acyl-carrier-protein] synthase-3
MRNAKIISSGAYAPENIIPNSYFDDLLGVNVSEWLEEVVHINNRRWVSDNESTSDVAYEAAKVCIDASGVDVKDIDLIILATDTPDYISPSTASVLQNKLGCVHAGSFDMNTACAGFVTALDTASKYIKADENYNNVLVIGAYVMSEFLDKTDKKTVTLFADGAGAVMLQSTQNSDVGYQASKLMTMGQYADWMGIYGGGTRNPISQTVLENKDHRLKFVKKFPPEINPETWSQMALYMNDVLHKRSEDVDQYFITQININSIWETMDILAQPHDKAHTIMHEYGYTGSACIPMAFHDTWTKGKVKEGDLVYFIGSGGGLAFASAAFVL